MPDQHDWQPVVLRWDHWKIMIGNMESPVKQALFWFKESSHIVTERDANIERVKPPHRTNAEVVDGMGVPTSSFKWQLQQLFQNSNKKRHAPRETVARNYLLHSHIYRRGLLDEKVTEKGNAIRRDSPHQRKDATLAPPTVWHHFLTYVLVHRSPWQTMQLLGEVSEISKLSDTAAPVS